MNALYEKRAVASARWFVTGATGHLGSFLIRLLLQQGHEVAILRRTGSNLWRIHDVENALLHVQGDMSQPEGWRRQFLDFQPEVVFHLAWEGVSAADRDAANQMTRNVTATLRLLELSHEARVRVFASTGSQAEYGPCSHRICESLQPKPCTSYGVAKYCLSMLINRYCEAVGMRAFWFRIFSVYGPMDNTFHMLPTLIQSLLEGWPMALTSAEQMWDYLYVEDAVRAFYAAVANPDAHGIYNVASGQAVRLRSIMESVRDQIAPSIPLRFGELAVKPGAAAHLEGDVEKLKLATGWSPRVDLASGLAETVAWYRNSFLSMDKTVRERASRN